MIVGVELNPPFSFFFEDNVRKLFNNSPVEGTQSCRRRHKIPTCQKVDDLVA